MGVIKMITLVLSCPIFLNTSNQQCKIAELVGLSVFVCNLFIFELTPEVKQTHCLVGVRCGYRDEGVICLVSYRRRSHVISSFDSSADLVFHILRMTVIIQNLEPVILPASVFEIGARESLRICTQ
jgi:hypothetical protein